MTELSKDICRSLENIHIPIELLISQALTSSYLLNLLCAVTGPGDRDQPPTQACLVAQTIPTAVSPSSGPQDASFLGAYMALNTPPKTLSELLAHKGGVRVATRTATGMHWPYHTESYIWS